MSEKACQNPRLGKVGGQAVLEGVMMKGSTNTVAVSVRCPDGSIKSEKSEFVSLRKKHKFFNLPIIRGVVNFIEMLKLSMSTLTKSAELAGLDTEEEESKFEKWLNKTFGKNIMDVIMAVSTILGIALAVVIFIWLPTTLATLFTGALVNAKAIELGSSAYSVIDGVSTSLIKIIIFILYIWLVSFMKDIRRTFEYHGAEHKSIFCYEAGEELTVANVKKMKRFHPRCGTSFMFVMLILGMILAVIARLVISLCFGFNPQGIVKTLFYTGVNLVILLPIVCGVGFEFLMYAGKHNNLFVRILSAPGLWMQRLTTREPDDSQIEVAIRSLKLALPEEFPDEKIEEEKKEDGASHNEAD